MTAKIDGTNGLLQQYDYQASTTGFSYTFAAGTTVLVINPAGTLATGTITMPAAPADGMTISFSSTKIITALTVSPNTGQSIVGNPTTILAGGAMTFVYRLSNTTWYAQINTASASTTTGVNTMTVAVSPGTWTKPATVKSIKVTVVGGGGAGGTGTVPSNGGSGGGGGGTSIAYYSAPSLPGPQPYTVGAAASTSSFGVAPATVISATGGGAGGNSPGGASGSGGIGSGGSLNIAGGSGSGGGIAFNGAGGSSYIGGGGIALGSTAVGAVGRAYGGGGSGGKGGFGGGAGAAGVVIIEEFY